MSRKVLSCYFELVDEIPVRVCEHFSILVSKRWYWSDDTRALEHFFEKETQGSQHEDARNKNWPVETPLAMSIIISVPQL